MFAHEWPNQLRPWQEAAFRAYEKKGARDFLLEATPGAGKTVAALRIAHHLLRAGIVERVCVVCHTEYLTRQWAGESATVGIPLDPEFTGRANLTADFTGIAVTYQLVSMNSLVFRGLVSRHRTLVIFDEIHHVTEREGELAWGAAMKEAFGDAARRLCLSGTPFRSDFDPISFVEYVDGVSQSDYRYSYSEALQAGDNRPVVFPHYEGDAHYVDTHGEEIRRRFAEATSDLQRRKILRSILDPQRGLWIRQVLGEADSLLSEIRREVPDAAGLIVAVDQAHAQAIGRLMRELGFDPPTVAISEDPNASDRIREFKVGTGRWLVAVRMVSEGVDIPRLQVGVYATNTLTEMFFRQFVGRFVRMRGRGDAQLGHVFLFDYPQLLEWAENIKEERRHELERDDEDFSESESPDCLERLSSQFQVLGAQAEKMGEICDGERFDPAEEAWAVGFRRNFPGGTLGPNVSIAQIIRAKREAEVASAAHWGTATTAERQAAAAPHEVRDNLRRRRGRLAGVVATAAARVTKRPMFQEVNLAVLKRTNVRVKDASIAQLQEQIRILQGWINAGDPWSRDRGPSGGAEVGDE